MLTGLLRVPTPRNEPVLEYKPGSPERAELRGTLSRLAANRIEIPMLIGGKEVRSGKLAEARMPHRHAQVLATYHQAESQHVTAAIEAAMDARREWGAMPFHHRAAIFLRAADLLATKYRPILNAATMLGQSKTAYQAEIDSACESIDFFRFNVAFAEGIL